MGNEEIHQDALRQSEKGLEVANGPGGGRSAKGDANQLTKEVLGSNKVTKAPSTERHEFELFPEINKSIVIIAVALQRGRNLR